MLSADLLSEPATVQARIIATGQLSPAELMTATLDRIERRNPELGAIVTHVAESAMKQARQATNDPPARLPPLFGLPFTVKDTIEVAGARCTAGSRLLDYVPARSAPAVERLQRAGAIVVGKTNCAEFGMGRLETSNLVFGQTRNPWDRTRTPGGSSGGDSSAVAAGLSSFGVGTDYGGSIRFPAHCAGIAGLRPTPGRLAAGGMLPQYLSTPAAVRHSEVQRELQTIGLLARSVEDLQLLLGTLSPADVAPPGPERVAWFVDAVEPEVEAAVRAAGAALAASGHPVTAVEPPGLLRAADVLAELRAAEGLPEIDWLSRGRRGELTPIVRAELDRPPTPARPDLADEVARLRRTMAEFLDQWPVLLLPVAAGPAFPIVEGTQPDRSHLDRCTRGVTLLRLAAASVPCALSSSGLPIGVQVVCAPGRDELALATAVTLERAFGRFVPFDRSLA